MSSFSIAIHHAVTAALIDLKEAQAKGKIPKNPLSETHFLAAWTTNAIKQKRFDSALQPTLTAWQRKARSLGKNAGLVETFTAIKAHYEHILDDHLATQAVTKAQVAALCEQLSSSQWMVNTDIEVGEKLNRHSAGQASLIICSQAYQAHFSDDVLTQPLSLYIRGDIEQALRVAYQNHLLLYKVTDYKSKVKYHGEYLIYTNNDGTFLPELVTL